MPGTLGAHIVKSAYGHWLPGDDRGHWSTAWDPQVGYVQPHMLHEGDPVRRRMAAEHLRHPPVPWSEAVCETLVLTIERCAAESPWDAVAFAVEPTHLHLLITYAPMNLDRTCKWLAQQMTKAVHTQTTHTDPVFAKGKWATFIFDESHWRNTLRYIQRHPGSRG